MPGLLARFESGGGRVVTEAAVSSLRFDAAGAVEGVVARTPNGLRLFNAPSVILATGGFQGSPAMRVWAMR